MINIFRYVTADKKYMERLESEELNKAVILYAFDLIERVNAALKYVGVETVQISSGFRPSKSNGVVGGSAKSAHMTGQAIDIVDDKNQTLCKLFTKEVLEKFNLYREDSDYTKGKYTNWMHLQIRPTRSGNRIFRP